MKKQLDLFPVDLFLAIGTIPILLIDDLVQSRNYSLFLHWYIFFVAIYLILRTKNKIGIFFNKTSIFFSEFIGALVAIIFNPVWVFPFSKNVWLTIEMILIVVSIFIIGAYSESLSQKRKTIFKIIKNCLLVCAVMLFFSWASFSKGAIAGVIMSIVFFIPGFMLIKIFIKDGLAEIKGLSQAFYWYKKSAEQGYADAQYDLGWMYYNGDGTVIHKKQAFYWYKKSAKQGYAKAQYNLGLMYYNGEGTLTDKKQAASWMKKAKKNGYQKPKDKPFATNIYKAILSHVADLKVVKIADKVTSTYGNVIHAVKDGKPVFVIYGAKVGKDGQVHIGENKAVIIQTLNTEIGDFELSLAEKGEVKITGVQTKEEFKKGLAAKIVSKGLDKAPEGMRSTVEPSSKESGTTPKEVKVAKAGVGARVMEAQAEELGIEAPKPGKGYSKQELVDMGHEVYNKMTQAQIDEYVQDIQKRLKNPDKFKINKNAIDEILVREHNARLRADYDRAVELADYERAEDLGDK